MFVFLQKVSWETETDSSTRTVHWLNVDAEAITLVVMGWSTELQMHFTF